MIASLPNIFEPPTHRRKAGAPQTLLSNASKSFRSAGVTRYIFENLTLTMRPAERLVLMGPNACGKSTLLGVLLGLQQLDNGSCGLRLEERDLRATVLQDYRRQLLAWASVETNLLLPFNRQQEQGAEKQAVLSCAARLLAALGYDISLRSKVAHLSGGQQQALVLARALTGEARFLVWDEPTSAIDFPKRVSFYRMLQSYCRAHAASVIIVTHDFDEALLLADRIVVFSERMQVLCDIEIEAAETIREPQFLVTDEAQSIRANINAAILGQRKPWPR